MIRLLAAIFSAAVIFVPGAASAVSLSLAGDLSTYQDFVLDGSFDLDNAAGYAALTGGLGVAGDTVKVLYDVDKNATNGLTVDGPAKVTYTYLGKEAGFNNSLKLSTGDSTIFESNVSELGDKSGPYDLLGGLLGFKLISNSDADHVYNDGKATGGMNIAYLMLTSTSWLVFLDDYGAGPDHDFDDIGFRIDITPVPLPAALPLLGAGLGALGYLGWRNKRVATAVA